MIFIIKILWTFIFKLCTVTSKINFFNWTCTSLWCWYHVRYSFDIGCYILLNQQCVKIRSYHFSIHCPKGSNKSMLKNCFQNTCNAQTPEIIVYLTHHKCKIYGAEFSSAILECLHGIQHLDKSIWKLL